MACLTFTALIAMIFKVPCSAWCKLPLSYESSRKSRPAHSVLSSGVRGFNYPLSQQSVTHMLWLLKGRPPLLLRGEKEGVILLVEIFPKAPEAQQAVQLDAPIPTGNSEQNKITMYSGFQDSLRTISKKSITLRKNGIFIWLSFSLKVY